MPIMRTVRTFFITGLALLATAAPAVADEATLEGYGGDGALLVGIDQGDSPFAGRPGGGGGGDDGNLVAERAPSATAPSSGIAPQTTPGSPGPEVPATEGPSAPGERGEGRERDGSQPRSEAGRSERGPAPPAAEALPSGETGGASSTSSGAGLPLTDTQLAFLLAGMLGLAVIGAGMRKMVASQPRL